MYTYSQYTSNSISFTRGLFVVCTKFTEPQGGLGAELVSEDHGSQDQYSCTHRLQSGGALQRVARRLEAWHSNLLGVL